MSAHFSLFCRKNLGRKLRFLILVLLFAFFSKWRLVLPYSVAVVIEEENAKI